MPWQPPAGDTPIAKWTPPPGDTPIVQPPSEERHESGWSALWQGALKKAKEVPDAAATLWREALAAGAKNDRRGALKEMRQSPFGSIQERPDFQTAMNVGLSAGPGNIGGASARGAAGLAPRAAAPTAQSTLLAQKVPLTPAQRVPGQALGQAARTTEDKLQSVPILGDFIANMRAHSIDGFNRGTINQALAPIGASLPKGEVAGHAAIRTMNKAASQAYTDIFKQMPRVTVDPPLVGEIAQIELAAKKAPDTWRAVKNEWDKAFGNIPKMGSSVGAKGGNLRVPPAKGADIWKAMSDMLAEGKRLVGSDRYFERQAGELLLQGRKVMFDAVERQYPNLAPDLQKANQTWAMVTRIQNAAQRRAGAEGRFTPMDLLTSVRTADPTLRHRAFGEGDALLQQWAEAGQKILPAHYPESGTAGRLLLGGAGVATGAGLGHLPEALGTLGALGAAGAGYKALGAGMGSQGARAAAGEVARRGVISTTTRPDPKESVTNQ